MTNHAIVLAMHGAPPRDFPMSEVAEFHALHAMVEHGAASVSDEARARAGALERKMRSWPRCPENDPFWAASSEIGRHLAELTGCRVIVGFNEFCAPDLDSALAEAAEHRPGRVIVVTPMLTRGGGHAEHDIPAAIARAQAAWPDVPFVYAWPYEPADVAGFLADRIMKLSG